MSGGTAHRTLGTWFLPRGPAKAEGLREGLSVGPRLSQHFHWAFCELHAHPELGQRPMILAAGTDHVTDGPLPASTSPLLPKLSEVCLFTPRPPSPLQAHPVPGQGQWEEGVEKPRAAMTEWPWPGLDAAPGPACPAGGITAF